MKAKHVCQLPSLVVLAAGLVLLTGFAAPARGQVVLTPDKLLFQCVAGQQCPAQTVVLTNAGNKTVKIYSIALSGSGAFVLTTSCGSQLSPGQSCAVTILVTGSKAGVFTGVLTADDSAPNSPQKAFLKAIVKGQG